MTAKAPSLACIDTIAIQHQNVHTILYVQLCELLIARWSWAPVPRQQWLQWILCNGDCLLQTSKLILTSKRDGSALAATMVFALRAEVDARGL